VTSPTKTFSELLGALDLPMFAVTVVAADDGERSGCLIGFATQCSISPGRFLACISIKNHTAGVIARATHVAVHVVGDDQRDLAELFGGKTGDEVDKFARCEWSEGPFGLPILAGVDGWFAGRILDSFDLGDHTGYLLEVAEAEVEEEVDELGFQEARKIDPGHEA
jgi:flavin reductase (DIM6/NTAB) family NADH-FMN oxidoreductase RutF